eukprot:1158205-Pelagomonas_calceolata.AAC.2
MPVTLFVPYKAARVEANVCMLFSRRYGVQVDPREACVAASTFTLFSSGNGVQDDTKEASISGEVNSVCVSKPRRPQPQEHQICGQLIGSTSGVRISCTCTGMGVSAQYVEEATRTYTYIASHASRAHASRVYLLMLPGQEDCSHSLLENMRVCVQISDSTSSD